MRLLRLFRLFHRFHQSTLLILLVTAMAASTAADAAERFFDFSIGGMRCGYYREVITADRLLCHARFRIGGAVNDSYFEYRLADGKTVAFRLDPDEPFADLPAGHIPTGGVLLLVPTIRAATTIAVVKEGDLAERWQATLTPIEDKVTEFRGERAGRTFWLKDGVIVRVDWGGGAISELKKSKADALAGVEGIE